MYDVSIGRGHGMHYYFGHTLHLLLRRNTYSLVSRDTNIILLGKTKCQTEMITVSPCS